MFNNIIKSNKVKRNNSQRFTNSSSKNCFLKKDNEKSRSCLRLLSINPKEHSTSEKTLTFLNKFVFNLNALVERNERQSKAKQISGNSNIYMNNNAQDENENTVVVNGSLNNTTTVTNNIDEYSSSNNNLVDVKDKINNINK